MAITPRKFVNSNARFHGKRLHDIPIVSPDTLGGRTEPILICSRVIHNQLHLSNELLSVY